MILKGYLFGIGYGILCLLLSLVLYKAGLAKKYTRKVVHILVGFEWVILYHYFGAGLHFLAVCVTFLLLLTVAYKGKFMPMISSEDDNAPGTVYYGVAMTGVAIVGCFLPDIMLPFGIGILCTSAGDGIAGVVGQAITRCNPKVYKNKTLFGCIANFLVSFLGSYALVSIYDMPLNIWHCLVIAILSVELEMITGFGLDNISITWGVCAVAYMFMRLGTWNYIVPILLTPLFIAVVLSKNVLTPGGVAAALAVDVIISLAYGNFGFVLLAAFLVGGVVVDKLKRRVKRTGDEGLKGDRRDCMQVLANSIPAALCAAAYMYRHSYMFTVAFVAALSEALADTASSGIGAYARTTYDPFKLRRCDGGLSGGVSLLGTFAALVGAFFMGVIAYAFEMLTWKMLLISTAAAFLGCIFDSFLGSVFQVKYKCKVCGKITEKTEHCAQVPEKYSGFTIVDNDVVNLSSGVFSVVIAILFAFVF